MGNLLRPGLDFEDSYSTTISSTGITVFFSLATTSQKVVHGYDAICGYLQTKEQFDIYAYLPTHEEYSSLEYEDIGELQKSFLKIFEEKGMNGIKRFERNHKKQYRGNPEKVHKCKASIYGNFSAGAEIEKLMTSLHPLKPVVCHIVMMNGAATSMVSKNHTRIAPNTGCAESKNALDTSTDVIFFKTKTNYIKECHTQRRR